MTLPTCLVALISFLFAPPIAASSSASNSDTKYYVQGENSDGTWECRLSSEREYMLKKYWKLAEEDDQLFSRWGSDPTTGIFVQIGLSDKSTFRIWKEEKEVKAALYAPTGYGNDFSSFAGEFFPIIKRLT